MKNLYFQPQLTNLDDFFLAKIVIFSVLMHPMMTRNVPGWNLEEKTLIYQYILINTDKSARSDMKKPIFSAPIDQSGQLFG